MNWDSLESRTIILCVVIGFPALVVATYTLAYVASTAWFAARWRSFFNTLKRRKPKE